MVYISFDQKELASLLNVCNSVSPKRSEINLFTMTKITVTKDGLGRFMSINSSLFYVKELASQKSDIKEEISFLVGTDLLTSAVSLIRDDMVSLEIDLEKTSMSIVGAKSKHVLRINTQNIDDFSVPSSSDEEVEVELELYGDSFLEAIKVGSTSVGNPRVVSQPEFLSICLHYAGEKEGLYVASTDRFRMTQTILDLVSSKQKEDLLSEGEPVNYLLEPKSLNLLSQIVNEGEKLNLRFEKNFLWIDFENGKMAFRYRDGKFPDWRKILPQSFSCSFNLNSNDLLDALKQVYFSARTNAINKTITIEVNPESSLVTFIAKSEEDGASSESSIELNQYEGVSEKWSQSFNADYLLDYISVLKTENVTWEANPGKPSVLSPMGGKDKQLCLVSGLR